MKATAILNLFPVAIFNSQLYIVALNRHTKFHAYGISQSTTEL